MRETIHCPACGAPHAEAGAYETPAVVHCPACGSFFVTPAPDCSLPPAEQISDDRGEITGEPPETPAPPLRPPEPEPAAPERIDRIDLRATFAGPSAVNFGLWKAIAGDAHEGVFIPGVVLTALTLLAVVPLGLFCESLLPFSGLFVAALATSPFNAGMVRVCLQHLKLQRLRFADILYGFRPENFARVLVAQTVVALACLAPLVPGLVALSSPRGPHAWHIVAGAALLLLGLPWSAWLYVRLGSCCVHFILDRGCGPVDAIRGNWRLTRGFARPLAGFAVEVLPVFVFVCALFGTPLVFMRPYLSLLLATCYLSGVGTPPARRGAAADLSRRETAPTDGIVTTPGTAADAMTARPPTDPPHEPRNVRAGDDSGASNRGPA